jgi:putative transposase
MVDKIEYYPYSSSYYFFKAEKTPKHLKDSWIVKTYKNNVKEIEDFFSLEIDSDDLKELKKASSLVDAPDIEKKIDIEKLKKLFDEVTDNQTRNKYILKSYEQGYSQYVIAKIIGISQPAVNKIIRRSI